VSADLAKQAQERRQECTRKRVFLTYADAAVVAGEKGYRIYRCTKCPFWHLTTKGTRKVNSRRLRNMTQKARQLAFDRVWKRFRFWDERHQQWRARCHGCQFSLPETVLGVGRGRLWCAPCSERSV